MPLLHLVYLNLYSAVQTNILQILKSTLTLSSPVVPNGYTTNVFKAILV